MSPGITEDFKWKKHYGRKLPWACLSFVSFSGSVVAMVSCICIYIYLGIEPRVLGVVFIFKTVLS